MTDNIFLWFCLFLLGIGTVRFIYGKLVVRGAKNLLRNRKGFVNEREVNLPDEIDLCKFIEPLRRKTQPATVEAWLDKVGVFPIEFAEYYGIRNLSAVVSTLISRGWEIELVNDESGKGTHYRKKD
jgi:hypothetical protein